MTLPQLQPYDEHNRRLESNVHPVDWENPKPRDRYHLVVIGAGTAGLVTAAGAAGLGAKVALIERELMGGDCLNVGCVPSKALIGAGRVAANSKSGTKFGLEMADPKVDFAKVMERMRRLRAGISPHDSAQRFRDLGVDVFLGRGSFKDGQSIEVETKSGDVNQLRFKNAVIATGARASAPPIPGLDQVAFLTNENLFSMTELPNRFGIIGAGPIGSEMAQTFAQLGSEVHLFDIADHVLPREDSDAAAIVQKQMVADGVNIHCSAKELSLSKAADLIQVHFKTDHDSTESVAVEKLLVAVGRAPNVESLNLDAVGVQYSKQGIVVDDRMRTTNQRIFAAGDVASKYQFTHSADFLARIVIGNSLFMGRSRASQLLVPWATYTSPEVAHVGMYPQDANESGIEIDTYIQDFADLDRAILEGHENGFVKIHTRKGTDQILGATIVANHAGDMISEITMAMKHKIGLGKIASVIHPYPTQAEAIRKLGDQYNRTRLTPLVKLLMKRWLSWTG